MAELRYAPVLVNSKLNVQKSSSSCICFTAAFSLLAVSEYNLANTIRVNINVQQTCKMLQN